MARRSLARVFRTVTGISGVHAAALEHALARVLQRAHEAWPDIPFEDESFIRFVGERFGRGADPLAALHALRAGDLALAHACVEGQPRALAALERSYLAR